MQNYCNRAIRTLVDARFKYFKLKKKNILINIFVIKLFFKSIFVYTQSLNTYSPVRNDMLYELVKKFLTRRFLFDSWKPFIRIKF